MKMINDRRGKSFCAALSAIFLLLTAAAFAQTEKVAETKPEEAKISVESKSPADIPAPQTNYEYIAPRNIRDFMLALREAGKRGFRLDKITTLRGGGYDSSEEKAKATVLAGILEFDGKNRYDYNFFFAEGEKDPEQTLNNLAKEGWAFRDVISVAGSGDKNSLLIEDIFANRLRMFPTLGNIYVLERIDGDKTTRTYKLLKAGVGTGRSPTPKLQGLLDQAVSEGFAPVATYYSLDFKSLLSVDSFSGILVEKRDSAKKIEYKFVRGNQSDGLWKDIETFSKQGFRIENINFNSAILAREPGSAAPVTYIWLETEDKTFQNALAATLAKNPSFYSVGIYEQGMSELNKNLLIFENSTFTDASEIRFVNLLSPIPKQFKKNPQEYLKTLEKPEILFQKMLDEGFTPRDIYFSYREGLVAVFTRPKKQ